MKNVTTHVEGFFPVLLQVSESPETRAMNAKLVDEVKKIQAEVPNSLPPDSSNKHYSTLWSGFSLLDRPPFHGLRDFLGAEAVKFANLLGLDIDRYPLRLTESWVNVHGKGESQEPHVHPNHFISGVYYVKKPKNGGDFMVHSPFMMTMFTPPLKERNPYNAIIQPIPAEAGMAVMFRSFVEHSVQPNQSDDERISISFNFTM